MLECSLSAHILCLPLWKSFKNTPSLKSNVTICNKIVDSSKYVIFWFAPYVFTAKRLSISYRPATIYILSISSEGDSELESSNRDDDSVPSSNVFVLVSCGDLKQCIQQQTKQTKRHPPRIIDTTRIVIRISCSSIFVLNCLHFIRPFERVWTATRKWNL